MGKIALFGTSADPPTRGHEKILIWLADRFDRVAVWAADNPLKPGQTSLEHRLAMMRLLTAELASSRSNLGFYPEISHPRTIETVQRSRRIWPNDSFTLVVGSDLIAQLPRWYRAEELLPQVDILVVPRPGYPVDDEQVKKISQRGTFVSIAHDLQVPAVSSTEYRQRGNSNPVIPAVIEAYIQQENLYRYQKNITDIKANNGSTYRKPSAIDLSTSTHITHNPKSEL
ncbi:MULTISPECIES: nicotinate-nucleotide adenylyltransferase [Planktothricoides]|uniref:Probable nicotinate-nucleotide adenylyltransferase n=2 Tax=Planktothricoides raciborskii TaxID=132608 RepID=A0AAU8JEZ9_9CYAN|nr:nicotinate-nucleotide adenylyltransferase [Planktothricoides raciborskii]MBD2544784.1 nicotinate-nucleotide adenylyltransferase [Planktothricoides raciborskii FACHB-1370]MBD2582809.1 nicotinate-nucleotide adenylyltransferase [Planktothricoides raciborskii FACHB-1261]